MRLAAACLLVLSFSGAGALPAATKPRPSTPAKASAVKTPTVPAAAASPAEPDVPATLVDRVVATVDEDPILDSDLRQVVGLGLVDRRAGETDAALRRRVLDGLIEQRLRFHEVDRFGLAEVAVRDIDAQFAQLRSRFANEEEFRHRLQELGLDETGARQLVTRQLRVLIYVEERVGARVFVSLDDIRSYYQATLEPEMKKQGKPVPPLEDVREQIRAVLREQRLNEEIARWTGELRAQADVVDLLEKARDQLPAIRYPAPAPAPAAKGGG